MLTIHHLQVSQSERLVWLCEELQIPYNLQLHQRDPILSPPSIKALHPLGQAPIIQDTISTTNAGEKTLTLAESAACVEYIIHKYGSGRFIIPPSDPNYPTYIYWFHFANDGLQSQLSRLLTLSFAGIDTQNNDMYKRSFEKLQQQLKFMDEHLGGNTWLAGDEFSAADIMTVFSLTTMRTFLPFDLSKYQNILGYLKRVSQREGYKAAREKGDPDLALMVDGPAPENFIQKLQQKQT